MWYRRIGTPADPERRISWLSKRQAPNETQYINTSNVWHTNGSHISNNFSNREEDAGNTADGLTQSSLVKSITSASSISIAFLFLAITSDSISPALLFLPFSCLIVKVPGL